ncbi:MAG: GTP 3',8-cyclase MoaA [Firmicutes bacterium]|nr:GTP 3',8-cyclase MoaA [Bacillota bacterium]
MKDLYGRKINYLRLSVTDLCNLRCKYCMPEKGIKKTSHSDILRIEEISYIAKVFTSLGVDKIRLTGGEPLVRNGILDLVRDIGKIDGIKDFAMTTNGVFLNRYAKELKKRGLNRVNISLDTLDDTKYREITRLGSLKDVISGVEEAKKIGLTPIKINIVLIGGFNDNEVPSFINFAKEFEVDIRFIELMPIGEAANWAVDRFMSNQTILDNLGELTPVKNEDISSPANYYKIPGSNSRIGIINPISCKFCDYCNRVRVTATGKLKLCLHSDDEIDIRSIIREGKDLKQFILQEILKKPKSHKLEEGQYIKRNMHEIGG